MLAQGVKSNNVGEHATRRLGSPAVVAVAVGIVDLAIVLALILVTVAVAVVIVDRAIVLTLILIIVAVAVGIVDLVVVLVAVVKERTP